MYFGRGLLLFLSAVCLVLLILHHPINARVLVKSDRNRTTQFYRDQPASVSFSVQFPKRGLSGHLYFTDPEDGCTSLKESVNISSNWIAVMSMSAKCEFEEQVFNAQIAGYAAAIVYNNQSNVLIRMKNALFRLAIPSTFIGLSSGYSLAQFHKREDVYVVIVERRQPTFKDRVLLIILAAVSSCSVVVVVGITFAMGVLRYQQSRSQLLSRGKLKRLTLHICEKGDLFYNCAICLDKYAEGDKLRVLPCGHAFHSKCIDVWLTKNRKTCPLCNETVNPSCWKQNRAESDHDQDNESRPLLLHVNNSNTQPGLKDVYIKDFAALSRNRSEAAFHGEPWSCSAKRGHRSYGTSGNPDLSMTAVDTSELDTPEADALSPSEYGNTFERSFPPCHSNTGLDSSPLIPALETRRLPSERSGDKNRKLLAEPEFGAEEEVFISSKGVSSRGDGDAV